MTSSTSTGGTLNNAAKVTTNENNVVIKVEPLTQLTIQSPAQGQIEIQAGEDIASIQSLKFLRHGDNLEIFTADGSRAAVIIEDYYAQETPPDIYGIDDQGNRYTWSSIGATSMVAALTDGESSVQEATPAMESPAETSEEKQDDDDKGAVGLFGLSPGWAAAAAGLAAAAVAGGVIAATGGGSDDKNSSGGNGGNGSGNGGDGTGGGTTGPTGTLSNIQFINDNDPSSPIVITNGMTNDSTPTITGKVEGAKEGDRVAIKDGDTVLGYAIVDKDGNWVFTPIKDLGEGSHQITAELQDADGNAGHSQQVDLIIDTTAPDAAGNITVDGKPVDGDNITGNNTPTIGGDAEPGSTITITDSEGNVIGSAVADEDGHWEITPQKPLGDGDQDLVIDVTDPAGNNNSSELPINVDTIPPTGSLSDIQFINDNDPANPTTITNGFTNDTTPVITGKVDGAEKGDRVAIKDGDTLLGYAEIDENGNWSYTPEKPLDEGSHQITAELQDAAGNTGDSQNVGLTIDTTPPEAPGNITIDGKPNDGENITDGNTPTIGGSGEPGNTIIITDKEGNIIGSTVVGDDGHWELTPDQPLNGGNGNLVITEKDPAGNNSPSTELPVNIGGGSSGGDTDGPTGTLTDIVMTNDNDPENPVAIGENGLTNDSTPVISGKVEGAQPGDKVVIKQGDDVLGEVEVGADGSWTWTPTEALVDGPHDLTIELQDQAGNAGEQKPIHVEIDTEAPAAATDITINGNPASDAGNEIPNGQPTIGGNAEPGSTVIITDSEGNLIGTAVAADDGSWELTPDQPLKDGDSGLIITVKDPAGNSSPEANLPINVGDGSSGGDTDGPTGTLTDIVMTNDNDSDNPSVIENGGFTNDTTPVISGKVEGAQPGDKVVIKQGDDVLGEVEVGADGSWTWTPTEALSEGQKNLTIELQDQAGNAGDTQQVSVNIDITPPTGTTTITAEDDDGNAIDANNPTKDSTPTFKGQVTDAQAGDYVVIKDGDKVLGTATIGTDGKWEFTVPEGQELEDDGHSITATVTDKAGNEGQPSAALEYTQDTVAPTGTTTLTAEDDDGNAIDAEHPTKDSTPTFKGQVTGAQAGDYVVIKDGDKVLGTATIGADGKWEFTVPQGQELKDDGHSITASVSDKAGNEGQPSAALEYTQDTVAPTSTTTLTIHDDNDKLIDADNPTKDSTPTFKGQLTPAEKGAIVIIKDGETVLGSVVAKDDGSWEFTVPNGKELAEEKHSITATITDAAGNVGSTTDPVEYNQDNTNPDPATDIKVTNDVSDTDVATGGVTNDNTPTISGKAEAGCTVYIYDKDGNAIASVLADSDGNWRIQLTAALSDGDYSDMSVQVVDKAGNASTSTPVPDFTVDTINTNQTTIETDAEVSNPTPTFSGQVALGDEDTTYANMTITIYDRNGVVIASGIEVKADGSWEYTVPDGEALGSGAHNISAVVVDAANNEGKPGYLNGTEDGSWSVPAVLWSEATEPAGDLFGYSMMVSDNYLYISAPFGGLNANGKASQQGIIYAVKKEFAYLLDGSASIEKLFAEHSDMGTIIANNSDMYGDGKVDDRAVQGYGMKVLVDGWVAIYSHFIDTVYFVKEPLSPDFDLADITNAPNGHSSQGFMVNVDQWDHYFGFNISAINNADGTLTFLIGDIAGPSTESGSINTVTFNPDPDSGNWGNIYLTESAENNRYQAWIPKGDLPDGMAVGSLGMEDWYEITSNGGTLQTGDTNNFNFGSDIVNVGDIFGDGHQYVAIQDAEAEFYNQAGRGCWYLYQVPEGGMPNNFTIGSVPEDQLIRINNIGEGLLNEVSWVPTGDADNDEFNPHTHNLAILNGFNGGTDIAIGSASDTYNQSNGKVWILHADKIDSNVVNIGINGTTPKFDTDKGYGIISTNHPSGQRQGFGLNVIGGYDFNGDGNNDLVISDPMALNAKGQAVGAVYIVYGGHEADYQQYLTATGEINIQTILDNGWGEVHYGSVPGQFFGWSVDVLDMNNDNAPDLLVGAPSQLGGYTTDNNTGELTNPQYNGQVYVVYNSHNAPAEEAPASRSYGLPADEQDHHDNGIPLLLDGEHQNVDLAALTDSLKDTHSIDMSNGDNTLKVNNQTLDSWEGADGDALIVSGENGLVQLTGGIDNWHSNGTVTVDGKVYTEYQSSGMAEVLIEDRIHVNIL